MENGNTLWKMYRWKLFFTITALYTLIYVTRLCLSLYSYQAYVALYTHTVIYTIFLNFLIIISIAQVLQYFREPVQMSAIVYIYAFSICIISFVGLTGYTPFMALSSSLLLLLYSAVCLLRVSAPEVSSRFKAIACYNIMSAVLSISYNLFSRTYPLFRTRAFSLFHSIVMLCPYVLILLILYKMMQLPESYHISLKMEVDSIGKTEEFI